MTNFDDHERQRWAGRASAYERGFAPLCAFPAGALLDAAGVTDGHRVLDAGTGRPPRWPPCAGWCGRAAGSR